MAKPEWKDTSSWSKSDKDRTPKSWELKIGGIRITVHRHIHFEPTAWLLSCHDLRIEQQLLKNTDIEKAKIEAVWVVYHHVNDIAKELEEFEKA